MFFFCCCCLTSKPRTPTHAPPRAVWCRECLRTVSCAAILCLLELFELSPLMNFIDLLPPPPPLCSSKCLDDNSPFHPQKPLWDCAMLADMIGFFCLFVCCSSLGTILWDIRGKKEQKTRKEELKKKRNADKQKKGKKKLTTVSPQFHFFSLIVNILSDFCWAVKREVLSRRGLAA